MKHFRRSSLALGLSLCLAAVAHAQDLRISMYADITGLDPHDTSDNVSYSVQSGMFERLFQFDPTMKLILWPATGITTNHTASEFNLPLRPGVTIPDPTTLHDEALIVNLECQAD